MPGISVTDQYDALLTTTLRKYRKKLIDNIFEPMHFLKWLTKTRGKGKDVGTFDLYDGGHEIVEHLMYGKNSTIDFYSGYDPLDTTPQEGLTIAKFKIRELGGTISISRREQRMNSGEAQMINLLKAKTQQAEMSIKDKISEKLFADITTEPTEDIDSILLLVSSTPTTTTCGGVSGETYAWWRNAQADCGAYGANLVSKMRTMYNDCTKSGTEPDAIVCTQTAIEYYESLGVPGKQFVNDAKTADLGFQVLTYKGADMFWDPDFATDTPETGESMLFLSSKHIKLRTDKETNFITTEFIEPENQTAKVAKVLWMGNLTIDSRRAHGVLHGIDAS